MAAGSRATLYRRPYSAPLLKQAIQRAELSFGAGASGLQRQDDDTTYIQQMFAETQEPHT